MSAHPSIRRLIYRFEGTESASNSTVLTISGVPEKGFIVGVNVVPASSTTTPILSTDSSAAAAIKKILEYGAALTEPDVPIQPIYYEAHDDSGTFKIYLKPVIATGTVSVDYRIDIWPAA